MSDQPIPAARDRPLFTPGPLTTSRSVKQAMLQDVGSRDAAFIACVRRVRDGILAVAGVSKDQGYEAVLMQGSGTFGLESVVASTLPRDGKLLVVVNGAYGRRIAEIARILGVETDVLACPEDTAPSAIDVDRRLNEDRKVTHVAVVHCETTTGIINPVEEIGKVVEKHRRTYFVDSMSAFGAVPIDLPACGVDYLVSSANKCVEGVPGFSFVICRRETLLSIEGWARSLSLDLLGQWKGLEANGQFRFTPPTHAILAFEQALRELEEEGGVAGRAQRYRRLRDSLVEGMRRMGFEEYLPPERQSHILTSFLYPEHPRFDFEDFYRRLGDKGYVIYPGKVSNARCFRIGTIGRIFESDVRALLAGIRETLDDMGALLG